MIEKVFEISGKNVNTLVVDEVAIKLSSMGLCSYAEFQESWDKKWSLDTKQDVNIEKINYISQEENDADVYVNYKTMIGIPMTYQFSFLEEGDNELFLDYFVEHRDFQRTEEKLSPFWASLGYLLGLLATIFGTWVFYSLALDIANGTSSAPRNGKDRMFNSIVGFLGDKGVLLIGVAIAAFLCYKIFTRFTNPPNQVRLTPPGK